LIETNHACRPNRLSSTPRVIIVEQRKNGWSGATSAGQSTSQMHSIAATVHSDHRERRGRKHVKVPGLSICFVLMMIGILLFFVGITLSLMGNYSYQALTDYAGLIMTLFGLAVMMSSFFLYRAIR
jgi:hypothetical protein